MNHPGLSRRGRGAPGNPAGRFEPLEVDYDPEECAEGTPLPTELFQDTSRSIVSFNDSPDLGFDASLNPYRGCEHGCVYCYARPTHEYLGLSLGLDFEAKLFVKQDAPELLRKKLASRSWKPQVVMLSGVTDCYQPVERRLGLTRRCLEVFAEFRNPVGIVTKNELVTRDIDILADMATWNGSAVSLSVTTLDKRLADVMEPRASRPSLRLAAIERLAKAGIRVNVMLAPVVPGLTDHEVPDILRAVSDAGASTAAYILLRLPYGLKDLFAEWLERHFPDRRDRVLNRIRDTRGGKLYDGRYEVRGKGEGLYAEQIQRLFRMARQKYGLDRKVADLNTSEFRVPRKQLALFE